MGVNGVWLWTWTIVKREEITDKCRAYRSTVFSTFNEDRLPSLNFLVGGRPPEEWDRPSRLSARGRTQLPGWGGTKKDARGGEIEPGGGPVQWGFDGGKEVYCVKCWPRVVAVDGDECAIERWGIDS